MAELADARDLKSREIYFSYRFDPGFRHHHIAEWSSLVARRAHNPKVMRFKSHLRNQRNSEHRLVYRVFSFLWLSELMGFRTSRATLYDRAFKRSAECVGVYACRHRRQHTASFCVSARKIADNPFRLLYTKADWVA